MLPWQLSTDSCCGINGPLFDPGYQHLFPFLLRVRDQGVTVTVRVVLLDLCHLTAKTVAGVLTPSCLDPWLLPHTSHGGRQPPGQTGATFSSSCSLLRGLAIATLEALA